MERLCRERESPVREPEGREELLHAALGQLPVGVVVVDAASGRIVLVNEEVERLTGLRLAAGLPYVQSAPQNWPLARALATGEKVATEIELASPGGRRVAVAAAPLRDG